MGRCYEFGVSIDPSSEHAMIVAPEGGYCRCPSTGVTCAGRFAGCADIVSQPGRVPPTAPSWSVPSPPSPTQVGLGAVAPQRSGDTPATPWPTTAQAPTTPAEANPGTILPGAPGPEAAPSPAPGPLSAPFTPTPAPLLPPMPPVDTQGVPPSPPSETPSSAPAATPAPAPPRVDTGAAVARADVETLRSELRQLSQQVADLAVPAPAADTAGDDIQAIKKAMATSHRHQSEVAESQARQLTTMHHTMETLAEMVMLVRQEMQENIERHQSELQAVRRQMIELRASLEERIEPSAFDRIAPELRSIRSELDALRAQSPNDVVTASQLAETINTLRSSGVEEISAAHLVHSFQLEIRSLRELLRGRDQAAPTATGTFAQAPAADVNPVAHAYPNTTNFS